MEATIKPYRAVEIYYRFNKAELTKMARNRGYRAADMKGGKENIIRCIIAAEQNAQRYGHFTDFALYRLLDKYPTKQDILKEYKKLGFKDAELANLAKMRTRESLVEGLPLSKSIIDMLMKIEMPISAEVNNRIPLEVK